MSLPVTAAAAIPPAFFAGQIFRPQSTTNFIASKVTLNYKPVGFLNVGVVLDVNDAKWKPEILWNYEAGFKTSWLENRLHFSGAYFYTTYNDRINQILLPDTRSAQGAR